MARILVMDDDRRTGEFLREQFAAAGHQCMVADSAGKAVQAAQSSTVDLLVLDVMMPGGTSGFEVCRRIRSDSEAYTLPILILTAMSGDEEVMHGLSQGADDYVTKPFEMQNLLQRVERLLKQNAFANVLDEATSLPGAAAIKREVQKRMSRHEVFALACTELVRLREFSYKRGADARQKAIRHLGRILNLCGGKLEDESFYLAHMGGGYFACILDTENMEKYANWVVSSWSAHLPALYSSIGASETVENGREIPVADQPLGVLMCLTPQSRRENVTSKDLFEVLMRIRNKALASGLEGVYYDRRQ